MDSVSVTSQCSHVDVGARCCGLLECALWILLGLPHNIFTEPT